MTICRKCGKEIPDGQELCEDCQNLDANSGESYLDELMQSMGLTEEDMQEKPAASIEEEPALALEEPEIPSEEPVVPVEEPEILAEEASEAKEDDINELLNLLEKDYTEDIDSDYDDTVMEEQAEEEPEPMAEAELSLFNEEEGTIFADDTENSADNNDTGDFTEDAGTSVDDIYQEALAAVEDFEEDYEVAEGESDSPELDSLEPDSGKSSADNAVDDFDMLALDAFGIDESDIMDIDGDGAADVSDDYMEDEIPEKKTKKDSPKKDSKEESFWKKIFGNIITEQTAAEEAKERELEKVNAKEKAALKEKKKKQAAVDKEEKAQKTKEEKARKAAQKAKETAAKQAAKEEKKRKKAEREAAEVVGKINPVGAAIVVIFFGLICLIVIIGTKSFSYRSAINSAETNFEERNYEAAYEALAGVDVSESSEELEEKVRICMQLQKEYNSYTNYYKMKMYLEALDSLMKGIRSYDENKEKADMYGIMSQYNELEGKLAEALYTDFGVSETQARTMNQIEKQEEYTAKLEEIIQSWQAKVGQEE